MTEQALLNALAIECEAAGQASNADSPAVESAREVAGLLAQVREHHMQAFTQALRQSLARRGLAGFVQHTLAPLATAIGHAWEAGEIEVFQEHLFTELAMRMLRQALDALPPGEAPRVLLATLPNEQHALGLLMVEALLALEGACCIPLGTSVPLPELVQAARAQQADIVALSVSAGFAQPALAQAVPLLRTALPGELALWVGGAGAHGAAMPAGVQVFDGLQGVAGAVAHWRRCRAAQPRA